MVFFPMAANGKQLLQIEGLSHICVPWIQVMSAFIMNFIFIGRLICWVSSFKMQNPDLYTPLHPQYITKIVQIARCRVFSESRGNETKNCKCSLSYYYNQANSNGGFSTANPLKIMFLFSKNQRFVLFVIQRKKKKIAYLRLYSLVVLPLIWLNTK